MQWSQWGSTTPRSRVKHSNTETLRSPFFLPSKVNKVMPRSHIHGSPRRFYYGLNLTDDPGNANFCSSILMHYICMVKYYYVWLRMLRIRKLRTNTDCHEWCRIASMVNPASSPWMCDLGIRYQLTRWSLSIIPSLQIKNYFSYLKLFLDQNICCEYSKERSHWDCASGNPKTYV